MTDKALPDVLTELEVGLFARAKQLETYPMYPEVANIIIINR